MGAIQRHLWLFNAIFIDRSMEIRADGRAYGKVLLDGVQTALFPKIGERITFELGQRRIALMFGVLEFKLLAMG